MVINSVSGHACTGDRGLIDSQRATQVLADHLGVDAEAVLICSTGGSVCRFDDDLAGRLGPLVEALDLDVVMLPHKPSSPPDLVEKQVALELDLEGVGCGSEGWPKARE